jgi:broad specificity phosphatase PhoE
MPRASETAETISALIGLPVEYSSLFVERRRPSAQQGLIRTSPEAEEMDKGIIRSSAESGYRYADEENFNDLTNRSGEALAYLESQTVDHLLVVTHGLFLRVLLAKAIYGDDLTGEQCTNIIGTMQTANTGITVFTYDAERARPWCVITWNDHAHLG